MVLPLTGCVTLDKYLIPLSLCFFVCTVGIVQESFALCWAALGDGALQAFAALVIFLPGTLESERFFLNVSS